jgi:NAD(P)-dependent dehydrogenase (short-subunit alcohol dehydrogenase family)
MKTLQTQTAIISGALGDIGFAIATELSRLGANIALGDILPESAAADSIKTIEQFGVKCRYDRVDVSDPAAVSRWAGAVEQSLGLPSLIIPNAAVVNLGGVRTTTPDSWQRELSVNLSGAWYLAQAAAQRLLASNKPGRIVFIGSWAAHAAHVQIPTYCVSKAGMRMLCKCMALELAPHGILVNEVAPGYVDAGLTGKMFNAHPATRPAAKARVPINELITAQEVARNVAFLCDPDNRQITGTTILMDGGLSLVTPAKQ